MKKNILLLLLLTSFYSYCQEYKISNSPKPGECYVWCYKTVNEKPEWTKTPCDLFKKDSIQVRAIQYKLINSGYTLEPTGFLNDETIDAYSHFKKNEKKIKRRLKRKKGKK